MPQGKQHVNSLKSIFVLMTIDLLAFSYFRFVKPNYAAAVTTGFSTSQESRFHFQFCEIIRKETVTVNSSYRRHFFNSLSSSTKVVFPLELNTYLL